MEILIQIVTVGVLMGILDAFWLSILAKKFYRQYIGSLLRDKPNMIAAILFYCIYVVGVVIFVSMPAVEKQSWIYALSHGALFGLVAYATYDLTNLATIKDFKIKVVLVDLLWGTALTAVVATATYGVTQWLAA